MPVYTYACTACGARLEARQSFTDDALTVCPTCGGGLRKTYDSIGVTFNGSGFYRTDSRAASGSSTASDASKPGDASPATSAKPAAASGASTPGT